jgi:hypothetical protein
VFRIWWIAAVTILVMSVACGFSARAVCLGVKPEEMIVFHTIVIVASVFAAVAFVILSIILMIVRYYSNFFRDEGYLTFTLPVKRQTLFASKVISAMLLQLATGLVVLLAVSVVMVMVPYDPESGNLLHFASSKIPADTPNVLMAVLLELVLTWKEAWEAIGGFVLVFALEAVTWVFLSELMQILLIYFSITMGGTVAKKQKVLASIGIYYGSNTLFSAIQHIGFVAMFAWAVMGMGAYFPELDPAMTEAQGMHLIFSIMALLLLIWILYYAIVATILYFASLGTLERKLNLQ